MVKYRKLEWWIMKRLDYLIIIFVLVFAFILFLFFYKPYISNTSNKIQLIVNNQIIDEFCIKDELL